MNKLNNWYVYLALFISLSISAFLFYENANLPTHKVIVGIGCEKFKIGDKVPKSFSVTDTDYGMSFRGEKGLLRYDLKDQGITIYFIQGVITRICYYAKSVDGISKSKIKGNASFANGSSPCQAIKEFGIPDRHSRISNDGKYVDLYYLKEGIVFSFTNDTLDDICVFDPFTKEEINKFRDSWPSTGSLQEYYRELW